MLLGDKLYLLFDFIVYILWFELLIFFLLVIIWILVVQQESQQTEGQHGVIQEAPGWETEDRDKYSLTLFLITLFMLSVPDFYFLRVLSHIK